MDEKNIYLKEVYANLPRIISFFDADITSKSYGTGNRYYWAWSLIDFSNATFQGAVHGMARLWTQKLWPYETDQIVFIKRIDSIFNGTRNLTRKDGSLEESFPNEGSFCVTALVAFDLLCTLELLDTYIEENCSMRWQDCIRPMIKFLIESDETHGLISNHLSTAAAALARWHKITNDARAEKKSKILLDRILANQSSEGWFREYQGADPGYQSLCTYYLADLHMVRPDWNLELPLRRSLQFLQYFVHPDGSFGGIYGSRCTRFYYPGGILSLSNTIPEAKILSEFMINSISKNHTVTLSAIDEPNLIPMFNAYVLAAIIQKEKTHVLVGTVPAQSNQPFRKWFPEAGILIDRGLSHYSIVSTNKGGVVYHFVENKQVLIDTGIVVSNSRGRLGSSQGYSLDNLISWSGDQLEIKSNITSMTKKISGPFQFLIIRLLSLTLFRFRFIREQFKKILVTLLVSKRKIWPVKIKRKILLGKNLDIEDFVELKKGYCIVPKPGKFISIHTASQGYWQIQDEKEK